MTLFKQRKPIWRAVHLWYAGIGPEYVCNDCGCPAKIHMVQIWKGRSEIILCYSSACSVAGTPRKCHFFVPSTGDDW